MSLKVSCPHCSHSFSLKPPKPGKYKPKCTHCGQSFLLVIEDADPPKIRTGKIASESESPQSSTARPQPVPSPTELNATFDSASSIPAARSKTMGASGFDATMPEPSKPETSASQAVAFDATMPSENSTNSLAFDATIPSENSGSSLMNSPSQSTSRRDFSVDDVTLESAPSQLANAASNASVVSAPSPPSASTHVPLDRLGGYRIIKELGAGGMGSVYLAKQLSLDRSCALKTIQAHWASNPRVIARFIREAYAAAQLTHHNVVQIYDLGQDRGTNFFSMELVGGGSLDDQLKAKGKLPPKLAATLILQAARGLKFAHDHGMVHRDIKPANLMLTSDGLVKIADLGLVKTPSADEESSSPDADVQSLVLASARSQVTQMGSSMGTPSYMSPEQALDAANVDKRADIYSLGCTFYALLTGRPPFEGKTLMEVLSKHRMEKLVRPERVVTNLPQALGDVIEKMTEKKPENRYQDLEEVIEDLEIFLELREDMSSVKVQHDYRDRDDSLVSSADAVKEEPRDKKPAAIEIPADQVGQIDLVSKRFQKPPLLIVRNLLPKAWYGIVGAMAVLMVLLAIWSCFSLLAEGAKSIASTALGSAPAEGSGSQAAKATTTGGLFQSMISYTKSSLGFALSGFLAPLAAVFFSGLEGKSPLALRYRESFVSGGIWNWIFWSFAIIVALFVVYFLGLWIPVLLAIILGGGAGATYWFGIERPLANQRKGALEQGQGVVRQLRLRGTQEESIREAFAKHSGKDWEELFEQIFSYGDMRTMRMKLQQSDGDKRKVFRPYRDRLIDRLDSHLSESRRSNEEKVLAQAEKADLIAKGISASQAQKQAEALAASMVDAANETKLTMHEIALGKLTDAAAEAKRQRIKQMLADARSGKISDKERTSRSVNAILGQVLGSKFRFACAAVLLLGVGMWVKTNKEPLEQYWQQARTTVESIQKTSLDGGLAGAQATIERAQTEVKKSIVDGSKHSWVPVLGGVVNERNVIFVALAGLLMLFGTMWYGWKISFAFVPLAIAILCIPIFLF